MPLIVITSTRLGGSIPPCLDRQALAGPGRLQDPDGTKARDGPKKDRPRVEDRGGTSASLIYAFGRH